MNCIYLLNIMIIKLVLRFCPTWSVEKRLRFELEISKWQVKKKIEQNSKENIFVDKMRLGQATMTWLS